MVINICLMIILQSHLRVEIKQLMENGSKYQPLSKCFKDYQQQLQMEKQVITENLLNDIRQIVYFLYGAKETATRVKSSIINSMKL